MNITEEFGFNLLLERNSSWFMQLTISLDVSRYKSECFEFRKSIQQSTRTQCMLQAVCS